LNDFSNGRFARVLDVTIAWALSGRLLLLAEAMGCAAAVIMFSTGFEHRANGYRFFFFSKRDPMESLIMLSTFSAMLE